MQDPKKLFDWKLLWKRLTVEKFDVLPVPIDKHFLDDNENGIMDSRWDSRADYLLSTIGYVVGLANIWRFPIKTLQNGGGVFLIPYIIFSFTLGLPLVLLELGLAQFTNMSCTKAFKCVPVLFGIGWSQIVVSCITMVYYAVVISWAYLYLLGSLYSPLAWSTCNNSFNTHNCLATLDAGAKNSTKVFSPSSAEFFHRYVMGFEKYDGTFHQVNDSPGIPQWHLSISLLIVWVIAFISIMNGVKSSSKIAYFTALFPYIALVSMFLFACNLPGAGQGLIYYLKPNMTKLREPLLYLNAIEQFFFSLGGSVGGHLTLASHNHFHDNFFRDAVWIVCIDCFSSFIGGLALFPLVGYIVQRTNKNFKDYMNDDGYGLYFILYPEALSTITGSNIWTILFMIMTISVAMDTQFILLETVVTAIGDRFITLKKKIMYRICGAMVVSFLSYLCGLLLITPGGIYYFKILDSTVSLYGLTIIGILECVTIGTVYGYKNFRRDIKMMVGFQLDNFFFISMSYICPLALSILVLYNIISNTKMSVHQEYLPLWAHITGYIIALCIMAPVLIGAIYIIIHYRSRYEECTLDQYLNHLIQPPIYYGPYNKLDWLLDKEYKDKLMKYRKDRKFLEHVIDNEKFKTIYRAVKQSEAMNVDKLRKKESAPEDIAIMPMTIRSTSHKRRSFEI